MLGKAVVKIFGDLKPLQQAVAKARTLISRSIGGIARTIRNGIGRAMSFAVSSVKKAALLITASLTAIGVASMKLAMDAEESENLFSVSMGDMAESTRAWSEDLAKRLRLNAYALRRYVSTFNVMLLSMGLGQGEAAQMSQSLTQLAYDMASFYNLRPEEAFEKLQAGITGEIEPLKRLGIIVNETQTKQFALRNEIVRTGEALTEVEKIQARYGLIMEQTNKAQGDMERTLSSTTNIFRSIKEMLTTIGISIGNVFKGEITGLAETFLQWLDENKRRIVEWARSIKEGIMSVIAWLKEWGSGIKELFDIGGLELATRGVVNTIINLLRELWKAVAPEGLNIGKEIGGAIAEGIIESLKAQFPKLSKFLGATGEAISKPFKKAKNIAGFIGEIGAAINLSGTETSVLSPAMRKRAGVKNVDMGNLYTKLALAKVSAGILGNEEASKHLRAISNNTLMQNELIKRLTQSGGL